MSDNWIEEPSRLTMEDEFWAYDDLADYFKETEMEKIIREDWQDEIAMGMSREALEDAIFEMYYINWAYKLWDKGEYPFNSWEKYEND